MIQIQSKILKWRVEIIELTKKNVKIPMLMSGNAPISTVYTRSKDLTGYLVSIKSTSRLSVVFGGMGWEPHCEQLLFWYFFRGENPTRRQRPNTNMYKHSQMGLHFKT